MRARAHARTRVRMHALTQEHVPEEKETAEGTAKLLCYVCPCRHETETAKQVRRVRIKANEIGELQERLEIDGGMKHRGLGDLIIIV